MQSAARVETFFSTAADRLRSVAGDRPDGAVIVFELSGDGGGTWSVVRRGAQLEVIARAREPVDCLLRCDIADFDALLDGELDAREAFLEGRLYVEGDAGLVLRLNKAIRRGQIDV